MLEFLQGSLRSIGLRLPTGVLLVGMLALCPVAGRTMELIPSLGVSKATDTNAGDARYSVGLALRAPVLPFLKLEGGISYRQDSFFHDDLEVRMWPVTVSAWLTPSATLYAGGGLGWYRTTYDYRLPLLAGDGTMSKVGVHLGGGVAFPLVPGLGLDLNGRYVFMRENRDIQLPTAFNPDFWNASAGLAIRF